MTLYRTYRPQHFSELIGQDAIRLTLEQALLQNRVAHAYLFSGPRGTGKTTTARIFARALSCVDPQGNKEKGTFEPCNKCEACLAILNNQTSDIIEIDAASNRGIEDIRDLREQTNYRPLQLKKKVYIIDEVHMLTNEAFNALLKTIEEPPPYCLFILATTELHKVPLTIRSRCQLLRFERGDIEMIQKKLAHIIKAEKLEVEKGVTELLAEHADGGFRDAETLLENLSTKYQSLTLAATEQALGVLPAKQIKELTSATLTQDKQQTLKLLELYCQPLNGSLERVIAQMIDLVRQQVYQKADFANPLLSFALNQLLEAYILQKSSPLPLLPLEIACLNICEFGSTTSQAVTPKEARPVENPVQIIQSEPVPEVKTEKPQPAQPEPATPLAIITPKIMPPSASVPVIELHTDGVKDPRKAWKMMIEAISRENIVLGQCLKQATLHTAEAGVITMHVRYKFHADKMQERKNQARIHGLLQEITGQEWTVTYEITNTVPKHKPNKELAANLSKEAESVFKNP